jgi:protein-S-isoprenylcysteine O-methyltransferase Ste14
MAANLALRDENEPSARQSPDVTAKRDTAGVVAPPPVIYAVALLLGFGLEALLPSFDIAHEVAWPLGGSLLGVGLGLSAWFITTFRRARTPVDVRKPTSSLVTSGPFRLSRNPAYLSLTLVYAGIAVLVGAPWALATLVPALLVVRWGVIVREERYLQRRFGEPYLHYKARTRRWL